MESKLEVSRDRKVRGGDGCGYKKSKTRDHSGDGTILYLNYGMKL